MVPALCTLLLVVWFLYGKGPPSDPQHPIPADQPVRIA